MGRWKTLAANVEGDLLERVELAIADQGIKKSNWLEGAIKLRLVLEGRMTIEEIGDREIGKVRRFLNVLDGRTE